MLISRRRFVRTCAGISASAMVRGTMAAAGTRHSRAGRAGLEQIAIAIVDVPVEIEIGEGRLRVPHVAEGSGYRLDRSVWMRRLQRDRKAANRGREHGRELAVHNLHRPTVDRDRYSGFGATVNSDLWPAMNVGG